MKFVKYDEMDLICNESSRPRDGAWNWWVDKFGNIEQCRFKFDCQDHFYPPTKTIEEENIIGWAETETEALEFRKMAIEKQIPTKPKLMRKDWGHIRYVEVCPFCENVVIYNCNDYCGNCGQRLDWSGEV